MDIPRQLNADSADCRAILRDHIVQVFVDGQEVRDCLAYDIDGGWADTYVTDEQNRLVVRGDELVTSRLCGKIQVVMKHRPIG